MRSRWVIAAGIVAAECVLGGGRGMGADEPALEPPRGMAVCQVGYGSQSAVRISWSNTEVYERVEFSLDDALAPGTVDGTFGAGTVLAPAGRHLFGLRGIVGGRRSEWTTAEFLLLEESPLPEPVRRVQCELIPGAGGTLRVRWEAGNDVWVSGLLEAPGQSGTVDIPGGATSAEISLLPSAPGDTPQGTRVARLAFKNAESYFSEPIIPICPLRGPSFRRGDNDGNGRVNLTDPIALLNHLFLGGRRWTCDDASDTNDDGKIDLADPITTLAYLFQGGDPPPLPGPTACGADPTEDFLGGICTCEGE